MGSAFGFGAGGVHVGREAHPHHIDPRPHQLAGLVAPVPRHRVPAAGVRPLDRQVAHPPAAQIVDPHLQGALSFEPVDGKAHLGHVVHAVPVGREHRGHQLDLVEQGGGLHIGHYHQGLALDPVDRIPFTDRLHHPGPGLPAQLLAHTGHTSLLRGPFSATL